MMVEKPKHLSRRHLLGAGAAAGVAAAFAGPASGSPPPQNAPASAAAAGQQLVFVNGRIHTMDSRNTIANTVSIVNGRFSAVGSSAPRPGPGIRLIDLKGRTVVPGIVDNHNHIVLMGNRPGYHTPLENAFSIRDVQETLAARAKSIPRGAWLTTIGGFHRNHLVPLSRSTVPSWSVRSRSLWLAGLRASLDETLR